MNAVGNVRWVSVLVLGFACGPQVEVDEGGDEDSTGSSSSSSTGGVPPISTSASPATSDPTTPATSVDPDDGSDDCQGECGVECFSDDGCPPGEVCDAFNQCNPLPQLVPCEGENLHTPAAMPIFGGQIIDVELATLAGQTYVIALIDGPARIVALPSGAGGSAEIELGDVLPVQLAVGDGNSDGIDDVFALAGDVIYMSRGGDMPVLAPAQAVTNMAFDTAHAFGLGFADDDMQLDILSYQRAPEPSTSIYTGTGMGNFFGGFPHPLAPPNDVANRAFVGPGGDGMTATIAATGDVRRMFTTPTGDVLEGNRFEIAAVSNPEPVVDVSFYSPGPDLEDTIGILNLSGWTIIARAMFDGGVAPDVQRFGLAEPSRRVAIGDYPGFDYLLGPEAAKVMVVRGDCYDEYAMPAPANAFAVGDVTGDGGVDIVVATDDGLQLLLAAP